MNDFSFIALANHYIPAYLGQRIKRFKGHEGMVNTVAVARDERPLIVSGGDDCHVRVWDRYSFK